MWMGSWSPNLDGARDLRELTENDRSGRYADGKTCVVLTEAPLTEGVHRSGDQFQRHPPVEPIVHVKRADSHRDTC